jgi:predicted butyrate kinase (DUF1464 family)
MRKAPLSPWGRGVGGEGALSVRVAGTDPGTSSLDVVILDEGRVVEQRRFSPQELQADAALPVRWLEEHGPLDLVAGPSGYGLPLVRARDCTERDRALMTLVRPDERAEEGRRGVLGFSSLVRALCASSLPVVFLPGVIHLGTVPAHRKLNRIDLGTPDKLCVAALALAQRAAALGVDYAHYSACVVELGSAFTACVVLHRGRLVDGLGGTGGAFGWASGGAWDGEAAYLLSPLSKRDLFAGGVTGGAGPAEGRRCFVDSVLQAVGGLRALCPFDEVVLSGRLLEIDPILAAEVERCLGGIAPTVRLESLPGAWLKHAAQGAALVGEGLAGGRWAALVDSLRLREAAGTVLDGLRYPRAREVRGWFGV